MVNQKMRTTTVERGTVQERTTAAEFSGPVKAPTEVDRRILLLQKAGAAAGSRRVEADVVLAVNTALTATKILIHVQLQQMAYNEKGNLRGLLGTTATS